MSERVLKERLQAVVANAYQVASDNERFELAQLMTTYIGVVDPVLRDELIYVTMYHWLVEQDQFDDGQRHTLWQTIVDDQHLFYQIGTSADDSIFQRAFSVLWLPLLLIAHRKRPFLSHDEVHATKTAVVRYLREERDWRGSVPEKGWAHGLAHAADALDDLALCTELDVDDLQLLLDVIFETITTLPVALTHEEDERFVTPVGAIYSRGLVSEATWATWLTAWQTASETAIREQPKPAYSNIKHFLRSLYFRRSQLAFSDTLQSQLEEILHKINPYTG